MNRFFDWLMGLTVAKKIMVLGAMLLAVGLLLFLLFFFDGSGDASGESPAAAGSVLLTMPDASVGEERESTNLDRYRRGGVSATRDYWDNLEKDPQGDAALLPVSGGPSAGQPRADVPPQPQSSVSAAQLDPSEYSEVEIYSITNGLMTKAEVDANHAADRAIREARKAKDEAAKSPVATQAQMDSLYFARMEMAYSIASKYMGGQPAADDGAEKGAQPEKPSGPRRLDLSSLGGTGTSPVVGSLSGGRGNPLVYTDGKVTVRPARATFLKDERVVSGQRVIVRLLEDLVLSDGTVIPANTHLSGTCSISGRFTISISSVRYDGRMFRTDLSAYDNDGVEGIYCPAVEKKKGAKAGSNIGMEAVSGIASGVTSVFTGNPMIGRMASSGLRELSQITFGDGSVAINLVAGYEFYLFENVENQ